MKKNFTIISAIVIVIGIFTLSGFYKKSEPVAQNQISQNSGPTYTNEKGEKWGPLPQGKIDLQVSTAEGQWPKITEATIDPLDVKVGDTQKMIVVIQNTADIRSVIAEIETDNGIVTVPLKRTSVGAVAEIDFKNRRFFRNDNVFSATSIFSSFFNTALAQEKILQKYVYEGDWLVKDTHQKVYHTVFKVLDILGRNGQITLAWSDPVCNFSPLAGGNASLSSDCSLTGVDGWDGGNLTIPNLRTLTLSPSATFAWNPGKSIVLVPGGSIVLITGGGKLKESYLYYQDNDNDVWAGNFTKSYNSASSLSGYVRQYFADALADCDDGNPNAQNNINFLAADADHDGYYTGSDATRCVSAQTQNFIVNGVSKLYYKNSPSYNWINRYETLGSDDCNDNDASVWFYGFGPDSDGDGVGISSYGCNNGALSGGFDCNDSNNIIWAFGYGYDYDRDSYGIEFSSGCYNGSNPYDGSIGPDPDDGCPTIPIPVPAGGNCQ